MARRIGMKDLHVARITKNDSAGYTAEVPKRLTKAISGKIAVKKSSDKIYSDDTVEDIIEGFDSVEVEFEGNDLSPEMRSLLYGHKLIKGMLIDNIDDISKEVAIGWRARRSDGKYEFIWLYCGKFEEVEDNYETKADKPKGQTSKLKGTFYPREKDGNYRVVINESYLTETDTDAKNIIITWFSSVQEPLTEA